MDQNVKKDKFQCLCAKHCIPTTDTEKDDLLQAGLGEKEILFHEMHIDADQFRDVLFEHFTQLQHAGGFQLCKCLPNSRSLQVLSKFAHSSPDSFKPRVENARTYICPLQKDLDITPVFFLPQCSPQDSVKASGLFSMYIIAIRQARESSKLQ